ncbi:MAG: hypothetical protein K5746_03510 [Clostridiales bacterium]|nr:hypothetical protein [Clostridiales bacterium]
MSETEIVKSEHRALVFRMNRKEAQQVSRYLRDHSAAPEAIFAVDIDSRELIVQAKNAPEDDILILEGEEDVFDVEEEIEDAEQEE